MFETQLNAISREVLAAYDALWSGAAVDARGGPAGVGDALGWTREHRVSELSMNRGSGYDSSIRHNIR